MISIPRSKMKRYHQGLVSCIRHMTIGHLDKSFEALVEMATKLEDDAQISEEQPFDQDLPKSNQFILPNPRGRDSQVLLASNRRQQVSTERSYKGNHHKCKRPRNDKRESNLTATLTQHRNRDICNNCGIPRYHSQECRASRKSNRRGI